MARPRRFALALLCAAAAIGGFEWSGIENPATPIWNRAAAGGASVASADAGPVGALLTRAIASVGAMTTSHRELGAPAVTSAAAPATDAATVHDLIRRHYDYTHSVVAWRILSGWKDYARQFARVMPVEYRQVLAKQHLDSDAAKLASI